MDETQAQLIAEQLARLRDNIDARFNRIETALNHSAELDSQQRNFTLTQLNDLKALTQDHETRIRSATEGVTQFKAWSGFVSGSSGILSIISLIKSFFIP